MFTWKNIDWLGCMSLELGSMTVACATRLSSMLLCCCRSWLGRSETVDEEEPSEVKPTSQANLAAQHELHSLAETRTAEAQDAADVAEDEDDELCGRPMRRFAVKLSSMSRHMPVISKRFARISFSRKSKEPVEGSLVLPDKTDGVQQSQAVSGDGQQQSNIV